MNSIATVILSVLYGDSILKVSFSYDMNKCPDFVISNINSTKSKEWFTSSLPLHCRESGVIGVEKIFCAVNCS